MWSNWLMMSWVNLWKLWYLDKQSSTKLIHWKYTFTNDKMCTFHTKYLCSVFCEASHPKQSAPVKLVIYHVVCPYAIRMISSNVVICCLKLFCFLATATDSFLFWHPLRPIFTILMLTNHKFHTYPELFRCFPPSLRSIFIWPLLALLVEFYVRKKL